MQYTFQDLNLCQDILKQTYLDNNIKDRIEVSTKTDEYFRNLILGKRGNPKYIKDKFWRMLYLSANTICSLGLGDIVPITNWMRVLIVIESIFGLIITALFLDSLVNKDLKTRYNT